MLKKYTFYFATAALLMFSCHASAQADSGTVLETMNGAGYTYMLVDSGTAKEWVAIPETTVAAGDHVTYSQGMEMKDFHSKSLDRTFPSIIFSAGLTGNKDDTVKNGEPANDDSFAAAVAREQKSASGTSPAMPEVSGGSSGAVVPFTEVSVEKAPGENSYTVEEIFDQAEKLNGTTVRLRGKVVKFSPSIMGRNWIHLQDGTGNPMNNTHDLVVTTDATVATGDTIIVEGVLAANKDFGAGYKYAVIVEKAKIIK